MLEFDTIRTIEVQFEISYTFFQFSKIFILFKKTEFCLKKQNFV